MGWYGGTYGKPQRRLRITECEVEVSADAAGHALRELAWHGPATLEAEWRGDTLQLRLIRGASTRAEPTDRTVFTLPLLPTPLPVRAGAVRWVLVCPACGCRRRFLYARHTGDAVRCRDCHWLTYESRQAWDNEARRDCPGGLLGRMASEIARGGDGSKALERAAKRLC